MELEATVDHPHGVRAAKPDPDALRAFEERRIAPERLRALIQLTERLEGRLERRPLLYGSLLVAGVYVAATFLGFLVPGPGGGLAGDVVGAGAVALVLSRLGWWREVGFGGPASWRSLALLAFPASIGLLSLVGGIATVEGDPGEVALRVASALFTGFWEEGLTRGLLLSLLLVVALRGEHGPRRSVITAASIFGAMHLIGLVGGQPAGELVQAVFATLLGIGFGALLLRTNALWLLVGVHALYNSGGALRGGGDKIEAISAIVVISALPLAVYGLYLLRRVKPGDRPTEGSG